MTGARSSRAAVISVLLIVTTIVDQAALLAEWILRTAYAAPVSNQVDVSFVVALLWNHEFHQAMGFLVRAPFWNQFESPGYAKDMDIDGKDRAIACEEQGTGNGLGSHASEAREKQFGFFEGHPKKEREVERSSPFIYIVE